MTMRFCRCGAVVDGKCATCDNRTASKTTKQNGYGWDWQQMSVRMRRINPLCHDCQERGMIRAATECHHIVAIKDSPRLRMEPSNIVSLCKACHIERHRSEATHE